MNFEMMPIIKIRIEGITQEINSMLGIEGSELAKIIELKVKEKFSEAIIDMKDEVNLIIKNHIEKTIREKIKEYMSYGGKGYDFITNKVEQILSDIVLDKKNENKKED